MQREINTLEKEAGPFVMNLANADLGQEDSEQIEHTSPLVPGAFTPGHISCSNRGDILYQLPPPLIQPGTGAACYNFLQFYTMLLSYTSIP